MYFLIILGDSLKMDDLFCLLFTFHFISFGFELELWIKSYVQPGGAPKRNIKNVSERRGKTYLEKELKLTYHYT